MAKLSYDILKNRDFRLLLVIQACMAMALQAQAVIVGWQIYSLTHSVFLLGLIGLAEAVPALISALFSGHLIDTGRPYRFYKYCLLALVFNTAALLAIGGHYLPLTDTSLTIGLFIGVFISGIARSFAMPSAFSLLGQIVPREKMPAASGWRGSVLQFSFVTGPAAAGLIYGGYGPSIAWLMPVSLLAVAFLCVNRFSRDHRKFRNPRRTETTRDSIKAGWSFIWNNNVLLSIMALDMFAVLFGGAVAMLPAFADQVLHVGSEGLGLLRASPALGSVAMALVLALYPMKEIRTRWLLMVVAGFGLCMIGFGLSTHFLVAVLFLVLSGAFDSVSVVIRSTLTQWLTPDAMRGRVSSVSSMFIISSNEIGAFESGVAARALGLVPSIVFGGVCTLLVVGATLFLCPQLKTMVIHAGEKPPAR